jgi:hypothetical protein
MTPSADRVPAIIEPTVPAAVTTPRGTYVVPALITKAGGDQAGWRYVGADIQASAQPRSFP